MTQLLHDNNDVHIRVFGCIPYQSRGGRGLVRLGSDENLDAILNMIRSHKDVVKASFSHESDRAVMGEVVIDRCAACIALKQYDCFMVSSKSRSGGWLEWAVAAESNSTIHDLVYLLGKNKCEVQLNRISGCSNALGLTLRQEEILQFAYSNGYYEYCIRTKMTCRLAFSGLSEITFGGTHMADKNTWPGTDYGSQIYHDPARKSPKRE